MWKKIRILSIVALTLAVVSVLITLFLQVEVKVLNLPVRIALEKVTGEKVTLSKVLYRPFNRIAVQDLAIGNFLDAKRVTVSFNPYRLITHYRDPASVITEVRVEKPRLRVTPEFQAFIGRSNGTGGGKTPRLKVLVEDGEIASGKPLVTALNAVVRTGEALSVEANGMAGGNRLEITAESALESGRRSGRMTATLAGANVDIDLRGEMQEGADRTIEARAAFRKCRVYDVSFGSSTITATVANGGGFAGALGTPGGILTISGRSLNQFSVNGTLQLAPLIARTTGQAVIMAERDGGGTSVGVTFSDVAWHDLFVGSGDGSIRFAAGKGFKGEGNLRSAGYRIVCEGNAAGSLSADLTNTGGGSGRVSGSLAPLELHLDVKDWALAGAPILSTIHPELSGTVSLAGTIHPGATRLDLTGFIRNRDFAEGMDLAASVRQEGNRWNVTSNALRGGMVLKGQYAAADDWTIETKFNLFPVRPLLELMGSRAPVTARLVGSLNYSSKKTGMAYIEAKDLACDNVPLGDAAAAVDIFPEAVRLRHLTVTSGGGSLSVQGQVGLSGGSNGCQAVIDARQFPYKATKFNGRLALSGMFVTGKNWEFSGRAESESFQIDRWKTNAFSVNLHGTPQLLEAREIIWSPMASGYLRYAPLTKALEGDFKLVHVPLHSLVDEITGTLDGDLSVRGTAAKPVAVLNYTVPDTRYHNIGFSQKGILLYSSGTVRGEKVVLSSGTGSVEVKGTLYPSLDISGRFDRLSTAQVRDFFSLPVRLSGTVSGPFSARGPYDDPDVQVSLEGRNLALNRTPVHVLKSTFTYHNGELRLTDLLAKSADSELRALTGCAVDFRNRKFSAAADVRNAQLGPIDLFGAVTLEGGWAGEGNGNGNGNGNGTVTNASVRLKNIWINQHCIPNYAAGLRIAGGRIDFIPQNDSELRIEGQIDLSRSPQVVFRNFGISYGRQKLLQADGEAGPGRWDFSLSGKSMSAEAITELLNLPVNIDGSVDVAITGSGSMDHPELDGAFTVQDGSVEGIPFDDCSVQVNARQDVLTVVSARLHRRDQYTAVATGFLPFYLTEESARRLQNSPVDLTISVDDGSLNVLTSLSSDIKSATGRLRAQAHLSGTLSHPVTNGYLRVADGTVLSRRYFNKMTAVNVDCVWKDNLLTVREFTGRVANRNTGISGSVVFNGFKPKEYNLLWQSLDEKGVPIFVPELPIPSSMFRTPEKLEILKNYSHGEPRFYIRFTGPAEGPLLSGWVELENSRFTFPSLVPPSDNESILDALWPKMHWDLEIRAGKNCWYENDIVSANVSGGIRLTGKGLEPTANGKISALRGIITLLGNEFKIREAEFTVIKNVCYLEGSAETTVYDTEENDNDTIQLFIDKAEISSIKPRFISKGDDTLTSEQAAAKASGINPNAPTSSKEWANLAAQFLNSTVITPFASTVLKSIGIVDQVRMVKARTSSTIDDKTTDPNAPLDPVKTLAGTKYIVGKNLTDHTEFSYSMMLDDIQNKLGVRHALELSYRLYENLFLRGSYELENSKLSPQFQYDRRVMLEQQWRFGSVSGIRKMHKKAVK